MASPIKSWQKVLSEYTPRKIRGAFWYRAIIPSRQSTILNIEKSESYGGRYNTPGQFGALYLSRKVDGCIAEINIRPAHPEKYIVGKIKVTLGKVCDLTDPDLLKKLKLSRNQLTTKDYLETRVLGELARNAGFEGMIVPSAAGEFNNLVIFKDRLSGTSQVELEELKTLDLS